MDAAFLLFDDFETLDVFGPAEILGRIKDHYRVTFYSQKGSVVHNHHGIAIETESLARITDGADIFLVPGGPGVRTEVRNQSMIDDIRRISEASQYVLTVCTGSALLACTGLLDGRYATSNKKAFDWATSFSAEVKWLHPRADPLMQSHKAQGRNPACPDKFSS